MTQYSFSKGIWKGVKSAGIVLASMAVFAGLSDITIWDLIVTYVKPLLGSVTVGGVIAMIINYAKVQSQDNS